MSLFELQGQYVALMELADEDDQAFQDTLEGLLAEVDEKTDAYAYVMQGIDDNIAAIDREIERLSKKKAVLSNNKAFMKDAVFHTMKLMGRPEIRTDLHKFKICKNGGKLPLVFDKEEKPEYFPEKYRKITVTLDKDKIRADLEAGVELAGAHLGERGEHLRIS